MREEGLSCNEAAALFNVIGDDPRGSGVELLAANGYLIEQFLNANVKQPQMLRRQH